MPGQMTIRQQLESGMSHHQAGRLAQARAIYLEILALDPGLPEPLDLLGVIAIQTGQFDQAIEWIRQAIAINPRVAGYHSHLGNALRGKGQYDEAIAAWRVAIGLKGDFAEAYANLGNALRETGQIKEAVDACRQAVRLNPGSFEALTNLGAALQETGQSDEAITAYRQALRINPDVAEIHSNLGNALLGKRQLDEAIVEFQRAVELKPESADIHRNLGTALYDKGRLDEAIAAHRQAIRLKPDYAEAYSNLGIALTDAGQLDEAMAACRQAIQLKPDFAGAYSNLGNALTNLGQLDEAIAAYRQAIRIKPDYAEAHNNLGNALKGKGQLDEAIAFHRQAIRLKPDLAGAHSNLGNALTDLGQLDEAIASYRQSIRLKPDYAEAHSNLGSALKDKGRLDEAIASYRQAIRLKPDYAEAHSNLIYTLHFHPGYDGRMIHEELGRWSRQYAEPLKKFIQPHSNDRDPDRRLRIGYISSVFGENPVGWFLLPLLANHDHQCVEVFAYAQVAAPDAMTQRLGAHTDAWRSLVGLSDAQAADLIRQDRIDVLVDLGLHAANACLPIFAHKPAPVQVTYLAYAGSSGLTTMDYRLSDPYLDPAGGDDSIYSEQTIRLPQTYWCYRPVVDLPLQPPPALEKGFITFGCLNDFGKVNEPLLSLWARVLGAVPHSRLLLHAYEGSHRQRVLDHLQREGIDPQRVSFVGRAPVAAYLERYRSIDIALDTHPYGGGTTTCDALWMGVPVVSLAGKTAVGRAGLSILTNVGLPELVANTPEEYVRLAVDLAGDLPRLKELHSTLRQRMQASPLMDGPRFARNVEAAYRQMWRNWCQRGGNSSSQSPAK
jgi:predicted O-linked N-acetylglucosamine transferase (SPINDLY family)